MLKKMSGPKREVLKVDQKKLHIQELHDFTPSLNIMRVIKWRRLRWARRMSRMEETRNICILTVETTEGREPLRKPSSRLAGTAAVLLQAWSGPEGSRKLMFPNYTTTAQDGGRVVSLTHRPPLPQGNSPGTHFR
jgi:hypothetical protein